jgi:16S rRNA (adenine1518-N6/adenine1519-N6)-dimethyltransferase
MSETWKELQAVLSELGHQPKKSLGQNFLISDHVIEKIILAAKEFSPQHLMEIGPGPGALTRHLKNLSQSFQVIELDHGFAGYWREKGLQVHEVDALQFDWGPFLKCSGNRILVSNLPYQISSSLVIDRSLDENPLDGMVLMFQKEVAQRLRATFEQDLYGMLSVVAQTFWEISLVSEAGPRDFYPPPRIASRVLKFIKKPMSEIDRKKYFRLVKGSFLQPRKYLVSNLEQAGICQKEKAVEWLQELKISEKARAEQLRISDYLKLYQLMVK